MFLILFSFLAERRRYLKPRPLITNQRPSYRRQYTANDSDDDFSDICPRVYNIQAGDNIASLASKYDLSVLYYLNPKKNLQQLNINDQIYLPDGECDSKQQVKLFYPSDDAFEDTVYEEGHTVVFCVAFILGENYRTVDSIKKLKTTLLSKGAIQTKSSISKNTFVEVPSKFHDVVLSLYQSTKNQNTFRIAKDYNFEYYVTDSDRTVIYNPTKSSSPTSMTEYIFSPEY